MREVPPYVYILASKREGSTVNVTFHGLPSSARIGEVLFEAPRTISAPVGQFTDTFAPSMSMSIASLRPIKVQ